MLRLIRGDRRSWLRVVSGPKSDPSRQYRSPICQTPSAVYGQRYTLTVPVRADIADFADGEVTLVWQKKSSSDDEVHAPIYQSKSWAAVQQPDAFFSVDALELNDELTRYKIQLRDEELAGHGFLGARGIVVAVPAGTELPAGDGRFAALAALAQQTGGALQVVGIWDGSLPAAG